MSENTYSVHVVDLMCTLMSIVAKTQRMVSQNINVAVIYLFTYY